MPSTPEPFRTLSAEIRKVREDVRAARNASPFFGTGIHPTGNGGMESDAFDGNLDTDDAGTTGWAFNDQKVAVGELILRPGSIGNDSLTNPVIPGVHKVNSSGFAVTLSWTEVVGGNVTVPAGCTQLLATSSVWVYAINPNTTGGSNGTGGDTLWCYVDIGGSSGEVYGLGLSGNSGYTTATSGFSLLKTGLTPGSTIRIKGMAASAYASLGSDAFNTATISTTLIWLR